MNTRSKQVVLNYFVESRGWRGGALATVGLGLACAAYLGLPFAGKVVVDAARADHTHVVGQASVVPLAGGHAHGGCRKRWRESPACVPSGAGRR